MPFLLYSAAAAVVLAGKPAVVRELSGVLVVWCGRTAVVLLRIYRL